MRSETSTAVREPATVDLRDGSPGIIPDRSLTNHDEPDDKPAIDVKSKRLWDDARIARLAYLVGLGKSAGEISFDAVVRATPNAIYKMMGRLNLRFRDVPHSVLIRLDPVDFAALEAEADRRRMTSDGVADRVVKHCIRDKLYGAIIDG